VAEVAQKYSQKKGARRAVNQTSLEEAESERTRCIERRKFKRSGTPSQQIKRCVIHCAEGGGKNGQRTPEKGVLSAGFEKHKREEGKERSPHRGGREIVKRWGLTAINDKKSWRSDAEAERTREAGLKKPWGGERLPPAHRSRPLKKRDRRRGRSLKKKKKKTEGK